MIAVRDEEMPAANGRCPLASIFLPLGLTLRMTKTLTWLTALADATPRSQTEHRQFSRAEGALIRP